MQWLELMGPHGIGKTTLRRHIRLYTRNPKHPVRNVDLAQLVEGWNFNRPTTWRTLSRWHQFLDNVERLYSMQVQYNPRRRRNFCKAMMRMSIIEQSDLVGPDVWDLIGSEGMILGYSLPNPDKICSYFETMPLSVGVVVLEANQATIIDRNAGREPKTDFGALAGEGTRICSIAAGVLAERTRVLRLDAHRPIYKNVRTIARFAGLKKGDVGDDDATSERDLPASG